MIKMLQGDFGVADHMQSKHRAMVLIPAMQFMIPLQSDWTVYDHITLDW